MYKNDLLLSKKVIAAYLFILPHLFGIYQAVHQQLGRYFGDIAGLLENFALQPFLEGRHRSCARIAVEKEVAFVKGLRPSVQEG